MDLKKKEMKRVRHNDDPWSEECYMGEFDHTDITSIFSVITEARHRNSKNERYFVFFQKTYNFVSIGSGLTASWKEAYDWTEIIHWIADARFNGCLPIHRVDTLLFRTIAIEKRAQVIVVWLLCARRLGLLCDVAVLIGKVMRQWELRDFIP